MWVRRHFTDHPRPPSLLMPPKPARKKPVKARGLKEAAAKQATSKSPARKGKRATRGKENHPSGMAAPVSAASSVLTSAPISVSTDGKGMSIHYCLSLLTILTGCTATTPPVAGDTLATLPREDVLDAVDAEVRMLRGKYILHFCAYLINFFFLFFLIYFLAQVVQMDDELRAAREAAAGGSVTEDALVERPKNVKNLEAAMSLGDHSAYREFCVSPHSFLLSVSELNHIYYRTMLNGMQ